MAPASPEIASAAKRLISEHIHSVEQLEVLLLLRAAPDKGWTREEVGRALVSHPDTVGQRLDDLVARGLIQRDEAAYRYDQSRAPDAAVSELAAAWATRRTTVIGLIFSKPSDAVSSFSDAFRFRRDS